MSRSPKTLNQEDFLRSKKRPHNVELVCPWCPGYNRTRAYRGPASTFLHLHKQPASKSFICMNCLEPLKVFQAVEPARDDWSPECEAANGVRARRNALLNDSAWVMLEDAPLSPERKAQWIKYRYELNHLSVKFEKPSQVQWPQKPENGNG